MTDEPTEARQDERAIREKMDWFLREGQYLLENRQIRIPDYFLSLTVSSGGGKCPKCDGFKKVLGRRGTIMCYCPTCNGTGLITKTLLEWIKLGMEVINGTKTEC